MAEWLISHPLVDPLIILKVNTWHYYSIYPPLSHWNTCCCFSLNACAVPWIPTLMTRAFVTVGIAYRGQGHRVCNCVHCNKWMFAFLLMDLVAMQCCSWCTVNKGRKGGSYRRIGQLERLLLVFLVWCSRLHFLSTMHGYSYQFDSYGRLRDQRGGLTDPFPFHGGPWRCHYKSVQCNHHTQHAKQNQMQMELTVSLIFCCLRSPVGAILA